MQEQKTTIEYSENQHIPQTMLKAVVRSSRKYVIGRSKLFQVAKSLKLWCVDDSHTQWMHFNMTVDWVVENLHKYMHTFRHVTLQNASSIHKEDKIKFITIVLIVINSKVLNSITG